MSVPILDLMDQDQTVGDGYTQVYESDPSGGPDFVVEGFALQMDSDKFTLKIVSAPYPDLVINMEDYYGGGTGLLSVGAGSYPTRGFPWLVMHFEDTLSKVRPSPLSVSVSRPGYIVTASPVAGWEIDEGQTFALYLRRNSAPDLTLTHGVVGRKCL